MDVAKVTGALLALKEQAQQATAGGPGELREYMRPINKAIDAALVWLSDPTKHVPFDGVPRKYANHPDIPVR